MMEKEHVATIGEVFEEVLSYAVLTEDERDALRNDMSLALIKDHLETHTILNGAPPKNPTARPNTLDYLAMLVAGGSVVGYVEHGGYWIFGFVLALGCLAVAHWLEQ